MAAKGYGAGRPRKGTLRKGDAVRYSNVDNPRLHGRRGVVVGWTPNGWVEVRFPDIRPTVFCSITNLKTIEVETKS